VRDRSSRPTYLARYISVYQVNPITFKQIARERANEAVNRGEFPETSA
jgi:hypothetical protein